MIYLKLLYIFFKIGVFAIGGGYVILPMLYQDIEQFDLITSGEFADLVALSQMTPGPIAVNAATYVGYKAAGFGGAVAATAGVVMPSLIIILSVVLFLNRFKSSLAVKSVLSVIRPASVGLIASAVIFFSQDSIFKKGIFSLEALQNPLEYINVPAVAIFVLTLICSARFKLDPVLLTILAGVVGVLII
jgi:chromate transporter